MPRPVSPEELHARLVGRIRELVAAEGITLVELARRSDVSLSHLHNVLAGRFVPTISFVAKVAGGLGLDPVELLRPPRR